MRRVVARAAAGLPSGAGRRAPEHARKIGGRKSQHETERRASLEPPAHGPRAIDGAFEEVLQDMLAAGAVSRAGAGKLRALFSAEEPLVDAAWHVFQQQRDADDFQDTLRRILARKGGSLAASPGRGGGVRGFALLWKGSMSCLCVCMMFFTLSPEVGHTRSHKKCCIWTLVGENNVGLILVWRSLGQLVSRESRVFLAWDRRLQSYVL